MVHSFKLSRKALYAIAAAVVALVAVALMRGKGSGRGDEIRYETVKVDRGPLVSKVTATGVLSALVTVQVGSQVSGRIKEIGVDFNSPVKKGQVFARLDQQLFEATLAQAKANYLAAQAGLTRAKVEAREAERSFQRAKALGERQPIAQAEIDLAESTAQSSRAQVDAAAAAAEQARASYSQAQVNLTYTTIHSPIDGIVISRNIDVGQTVAASLQAPVLFVLAENLAKMQVNTSVAEADIGKLQPGMKATFTVDAFPSEVFHGTVRQIRNSATTVQNVVTYDAVVDVENPDLKLRPGMTANVTFVFAEKGDVLRVPNSALRFRPTPDVLARIEGKTGKKPAADESLKRGPGANPPGTRSVWVLEAGSLRQTQLKTGITDGSMTEIVEGDVNAGDALVTDVSGGENKAAPGLPGMGRPGGGSGGMRRAF